MLLMMAVWQREVGPSVCKERQINTGHDWVAERTHSAVADIVAPLAATFTI